MRHVTIKIFGQVHGVGFRDATYWTARKMHIAGFIMNEPDGSVYVEAEGDEGTLKEFVAWCEKGPWPAKVTKVETEWSDAGGKFTGFRIG
jgi:acylphosphatase